MNYRDAMLRLQQFLAPMAAEEFLDRTLVGGFRRIGGEALPVRTALLGADPQALLLAAVHLAAQLTCHSASLVGPAISLAPAADAADFRARIGELHARGFAVCFPALRPLSPPLDLLARALEMLLHEPVTARASWCGAGMQGAVGAEDHDVIIVQLQGSARWQLSTRLSELNNTWKTPTDAAPDLGPHETIDLRPGELLYLPRGTLHSVASEGESLHLALGFTPFTVRAAVIAALDHLSDIDRGWRMTFGGPLALQLRGPAVERLMPSTVEAAANLASACKTPGFLASALQARSARVVAALQPLPAPRSLPVIDLDTELIQSDSAFCHLIGTPEQIDVSYPGGHLYVPRSAQPAVEYVVNTPRFCVRDIPADSDELRLSLATRFLGIGFLQSAPRTAASR